MKEKRQSNFLYYSKFVIIVIAIIYAIYQLANYDYLGIAFTCFYTFLIVIVLHAFEKIIDFLQKISEK